MNLIQREMSRAVRKYGCSAEFDKESGSLRLCCGSSYLGTVTEKDLLCGRENFGEEKFAEIYEKIKRDYQTVCEYVRLFDNAKSSENGFVNGYRQLCDFNGVVLAAKDMENGQFEFVVWSKTYDGKNVCNGAYIYNYNEAKELFAVRSGLAKQSFSVSELKALYRALEFQRDNDGELHYDDDRALKSLQDKIENISPSAAEIMQSGTPSLNM